MFSQFKTLIAVCASILFLTLFAQAIQLPSTTWSLPDDGFTEFNGDPYQDRTIDITKFSSPSEGYILVKIFDEEGNLIGVCIMTNNNNGCRVTVPAGG